MSHRELNVHMNGQRLTHNRYPVYLGVTSDLTLSYREHLSCSAAKLQSRNNLIAKLAGTLWGASTSTLCTSALALCYSVAEYCCPVWARSSYTSLINTKLYNSMCLISGCLQPTQLSWLPVLSGVAPPSLCCKAATGNMIQIIEAHSNWLYMLMSLSIHLHGLHVDTQLIRRDICRHSYAGERGLVIGFCGQPHYCYRPYYPTAIVVIHGL